MHLLHVLTSVVLAANIGAAAQPDPASLIPAVAEQVSMAGVLAAVPTAALQAAPRFTYGNGAQGFGYYQNRAQAAPRPRTVGPGARNWATGNRVPLARPWMNAR